MKKTAVPKANQSRHPRPILYFYKDPKERCCYWFHGVTFAEFHVAMQLKRPLVIFDDGNNLDLQEDVTSRLRFVESSDIDNLARQDIYSACGDFIWVDTPTTAALQKISPHDLAALLYMAHTFKPLKSPFLKSLSSRFAYLAHDDGWLLRLYVKNPADLSNLLESVIGQKARQFLGFAPRTDRVINSLLKLAEKGVAFDFRPNQNHPNSVMIWQPGPLQNMDALQQKIVATRNPPRAWWLTNREGSGTVLV
jgi:hypothetical protein